MFAETFQNIEHVEIYALIAFVIFFTFFILVSIQAFRMKKEETDRYSSLPLEDADLTNVPNTEK